MKFGLAIMNDFPPGIVPADRVALLEGGVIAATGSHRELMAAQPAYAALMSMSEVQV